MFSNYKKYLLSLLLSFTSVGLVFSQAPMTVETGQTAQELAEMLAGGGVSVFNATISCPTTAIGSFEVTGQNTLGIDSGIVLSSGHINSNGQTIIGPNNGINAGPSSTSGGANTDAHLSSLVPGTNLRDVCYLQFDFVPTGDSISFDYVFASSEYWNYSCMGYNDPFGFFIWHNSNTANFQNIALIPGTTVPVTVNSTTGVGTCGQYPQYYNDNHNGPTTTFGGYTDVFSALAAVQACDTYTLKLAISDASDASFDSGVFLRAGSLSSIGVHAGSTGTAGANHEDDHCVRGCKSAFVYIEKDSPESQDIVIDLEISGDAINGFDYEYIPSSVILPAGQTSVDIEIKPLLINNPSGPKDVIIKVMSPYICYASGQPSIIDSARVRIFDSLYAKINTPPTPICVGDTLTLEAEVDSTLNFVWSPATDIVDPNALVIDVSPAVTTTYTFEATMEGAPATCPAKTVEYTVVVDAYPEITLPDDIAQCLTDSIPLSAQVLPADTTFNLHWSPSQNFRNTYDYDNMFFAEPGDYVITLHATSPNAECSASETMNINVFNLGDLTMLTNDTAVCQGTPVEVNTTGADGYTFQWSPTDGVLMPNSQSTVITPHTTEVYTLTASYPTCPDTSVTISFIVEENPELILSNDTTVCVGTKLAIEGQVTPYNANYTYTWTPTDGLFDFNGPNAYVIAEEEATYQLIVSTAIGCSGSATFTVDTHPILIATSSVDTGYCPPNAVDLEIYGGYYYSWSPSYGLDRTDRGAVTASPETPTEYTIIVTDTNQCKDTLSIFVDVYSNAVLQIPDTVIIYSGEEYHLNPFTNAMYFDWFPPSGISDASSSNPYFSPEANTRYFVTATTEMGCEIVDSVDFIVNTEVFDLPNAFNPKSGDKFKVEYRGQLTLENFEIFNRWGNLVYSSTNIDEGWDGKMNDEIQPMGVYIWQVEVKLPNGKSEYKTGNVTLIR